MLKKTSFLGPDLTALNLFEAKTASLWGAPTINYI